MRLLLADDQGNVHEVLDDIEEYDLDRPTARAVLAIEVQAAINLCREES